MMCGSYQPSGLDIHGDPTTTGNRCTLPAYHGGIHHQMEAPGNDVVKWSVD